MHAHPCLLPTATYCLNCRPECGIDFVATLNANLHYRFSSRKVQFLDCHDCAVHKLKRTQRRNVWVNYDIANYRITFPSLFINGSGDVTVPVIVGISSAIFPWKESVTPALPRFEAVTLRSELFVKITEAITLFNAPCATFGLPVAIL
jgi:hypothetical protein